MNMAALTDHSEITKALALKESREHLGPEMEALKLDMQSRATTISGSLLINSNPTTTTNNCFNTIKKTVHFIRHGQGFHNLLADMARASNKTWTQFQVEPNNPYTMPEVTDAPLTDKGRNQAMLLRNETKNLGTELVVVSPLCRATQTGLLAFSHIVGSVPFVANEGEFHSFCLRSPLKHKANRRTQFQVEPNNPYTMPEVTDAPLTDKGRNQAMLLRNETKNLGTELVVVSPLCRATQTGLLAFSHIVGSVPFVANEGEFHSFCLRSPLKHKANSNSPTSLMLASLRSAPLRLQRGVGRAFLRQEESG